MPFYRHIVNKKNSDNVSGNDFDVGYHRTVRASQGCSLRAGRIAHGTHCARVPFVETVGAEIALQSRHVVAHDKGKADGLEIRLNLR